MVYYYLYCVSILANYYFQDSFNLKVILYLAKTTQNTSTEQPKLCGQGISETPQ